jgi:hypothetical protein
MCMFIWGNAAIPVWHNRELDGLHVRWDGMFVSVKLTHHAYFQCTVVSLRTRGENIRYLD